MHHGRPGRLMCSCASQTFDQDFKNNKKTFFCNFILKNGRQLMKISKNLIFRIFPLVKKGFADRNVQPLLSTCIYTLSTWFEYLVSLRCCWRVTEARVALVGAGRVFLVHSRLSDWFCRVQVRWVSWPIRNTNNIIKLSDSIGHCEKVESATSTNTSRWPGTFVYL